MIALFLLWIFFNARVTADVVLVGAAICLIVGLLLKNALDYSLKKELRFYLRLPSVLRYLGVLFREMLLANWAMVRLILNPWSRVDARLYFFTPGLKRSFSRVTLANSITLTPGTITVQLKNGRYCVHGIRSEFVEGIEESVLAREVGRLEGKFEK